MLSALISILMGCFLIYIFLHAGRKIKYLIAAAALLLILFAIIRILPGLSKGSAPDTKGEETIIETAAVTKAPVSTTEEIKEETTELTEAESQTEIAAKSEPDFVFYFQENSRWASAAHGSSTIIKSGCGTVSLSMVLASLTGDTESYTPDKLAAYESEQGIPTPNQDTESIVTLCKELDTGCSAVLHFGRLDLDLVDETLKKGGYIILDQLAGEAKTFANFNHYLVIRGGNQKDGYYIANSLYRFSKEESTCAYAPQNQTQIPAEELDASYYYTITKE